MSLELQTGDPRAALSQVAARLANTGQVFSAWSRLLGRDATDERERLARAAQLLDRAVATLSGDHTPETAEASSRSVTRASACAGAVR